MSDADLLIDQLLTAGVYIWLCCGVVAFIAVLLTMLVFERRDRRGRRS